MSNGWSEYDDFLKAAEADTREGDKEAVVISVVGKTWPSGDPFTAIVFGLVSEGMAKADLAINPKPSPAECEAVKAGGDRRKMRGYANTINLYKQLEQHYGVTDPTTIKQGDIFFIKCTKDKKDAVTGKGGFLRVRAFLPKGTVSKETESTAAATAAVPF